MRRHPWLSPACCSTASLFGESPRWHDGRLWFARLGRRRGHRRRPRRRPARSSPGSTRLPFSIDWLPDGALLLIPAARAAAAPGARRLAGDPRRPDRRSTATAGTRSSSTRRGNVYVNGVGFDLMAGEESAPGIDRPGHARRLGPPGRRRRRVPERHGGDAGRRDADRRRVLRAAADRVRHRRRRRARRTGGSWADLGDGVARRHLPRRRGRRLVRRRAQPALRAGRARAARCCRRSTLDRGCFACMLGGAGRADAVHRRQRVARPGRQHRRGRARPARC